MSKVFFYLVVKPLSRIPLSITYLFSDFVFFLLYRVIGYRKKVVRTNMTNSFPEKSKAEIDRLVVAFYRHFCDLIVEGIRLFSMPKEEVLRRFKVVNPEVVDQFHDRGQGVFMIAGHYNNWELAVVAFDIQIKHRSVAIYAPLKDKFLNGKLAASRQRFGLELLPRKQVRSFFKDANSKNTAVVFANDQTPSSVKGAYWMDFLNQDTPIFFGPEKYAKEYNFIPVFAFIKKLKRGHYETEFVVMNENPRATEYGEITRQHTEMLEREIREAPEFWLWTHRRWKRKRTPEQKQEMMA